MSEAITTEQTESTPQTVPPAPVTEVKPSAPKPAQDATPRPRIPRPHCAC